MQTQGDLVSASAILALHDRLTSAWHGPAREEDAAADSMAAGSVTSPSSASAFMTLVARQHRANFDLWHIEDEARAPGASDANLAAIKRRIDSTNQQRNDLAEALDQTLIDWLTSQDLPNSSAALHSESPGLMIDRLSIQALKIYHTAEEADRAGGPAGHLERNRNRLDVLREQRTDLASCLDALWHETLAGTRRFKLYRQLKMYNDPSLNPAIYRQSDSDRRS